ncbi:MAG: hypothetical protein ACK5GI_09945 [Ignavibacteria bacterium]
MMQQIGSVRDWDIGSMERNSEFSPNKGIRAIPDNCLFLENDCYLVLDEKTKKRAVIDGKPAMCLLLSFLYCDLLDFCGWTADAKVMALARRFTDDYLQSGTTSLFDSNRSDANRQTLLGIMEDIHRNSSYRDEQYWQILEACELYLKSSVITKEPDIDIWGVESFASVWEMLCVDWFLRYMPNSLLYADQGSADYSASNNGMSTGVRRWRESVGVDYPFTFRVDGNHREKILRPDVVVKKMYLEEVGNTASEVVDNVITQRAIKATFGQYSYTFSISELDKRYSFLLERLKHILVKKGHAKPNLRNYRLTYVGLESVVKAAISELKIEIQGRMDAQMCEVFDVKYWPFEGPYLNSEDKSPDLLEAVGKQIVYHSIVQETHLFSFVSSTFVLPVNGKYIGAKVLQDRSVVGDYLKDGMAAKWLNSLGLHLFGAVPERLIDSFLEARL